MTRRIGELNESNQLQVNELSGLHIGRQIRFLDTDDDVREIEHVVTAELRQISQNSSEVHLTVGHLAEREYGFRFDEVIALDPSPDYSDVPFLITVNAERKIQRDRI